MQGWDLFFFFLHSLYKGKCCFYNPKSPATKISFKITNVGSVEQNANIMLTNIPNNFSNITAYKRILKEPLKWTYTLEELLFDWLSTVYELVQPVSVTSRVEGSPDPHLQKGEMGNPE